MVELREIINKRIDERISIVENKLRNSFQAMRKDNEQIRNILKDLDERIKSSSAKSVDSLEFEKKISELNKTVETKFNENKEDLSKLKKEISKEDLKKNLSKEILNELKPYFSDLSKKQKEEFKELDKDNLKKISKNFDSFNEKSEDLKKDFLMFKHEFIGLRNDWEDTKNNLGRELKELLRQTEKGFERPLNDLRNQIVSLKARNTVLTRELNSLKGNGHKEVLKEIKTIKQKKKKKGLIDSVVDLLAD